MLTLTYISIVMLCYVQALKAIYSNANKYLNKSCSFTSELYSGHYSISIY